MKVNRSLRPEPGPALAGRDLISFELALKEEIARFLPFNSYSLYFPDYFDEDSGVWAELSRGRAVHMADERSLFVPLMQNGSPLGVFVARGVTLAAPKTMPPFITRMAGLVLDKLALFKASITDPLTGLANRERLMSRMAEEVDLVRQCILPGSGASMDPDSSCYSAGFCLVLARLGGLNRLYERHGARLGDEAAGLAAKAFAALRPDRALCARPDAETLAMLLPGGTARSCLELAEAIAKDLGRITVTDPVYEHAIRLAPALGLAAYPKDLDGGLGLPEAKDQALVLMRRAAFAADKALAHGAETVFTLADVKARGGRVLSVHNGARAVVSLGRQAGAIEGERFLINDAVNGPAKGELVLTAIGEDESQAEVVHAADPGNPPGPGDMLALVPAGEPAPKTGTEPRVNMRTGLYSYLDFSERLAARREEPDSFALLVTRLTQEPEALSDEDLARSATTAAGVLGDGAFGGRYSLGAMIHFVPGVNRRKAKALGLSLHKALAKILGEEPVIGVHTHPYLSFLPADAMEGARKALEYALLLEPPRVGLLDSLALTISADKMFTEGRLFDAIEEYKLALLADKSNTLARNSLGVSLARAGQLGDAARHFKTVIKRDETDVNARYNYGYACMRMGKHKEAEAAFNHCLTLNPEHLYSLIRLGQIALTRKRYADAEKHLKRAEALDGGRGPSSRVLARLALARNRKDQARQYLHQAMLNDPHDALAMNLMAELYLDEGEDPQIAEALARQSAAIRPGHKPFLLTLAKCLDTQGKAEEAATVRARASA